MENDTIICNTLFFILKLKQLFGCNIKNTNMKSVKKSEYEKNAILGTPMHRVLLHIMLRPSRTLKLGKSALFAIAKSPKTIFYHNMQI